MDYRYGAARQGRTSRIQAQPPVLFGPAIAIVALLSGCQATPPPSDPVRSASILGLDSGAVRKLLGEPSLIRRDTPAEVWQYRTASCVLDVVLYDQASGPRVVYTEARTPAAEPTQAGPCLSDVLTTKRSATS
ncbi:MAG TPA: hypothetical protein VLV76_14310 [Candidatus Acidoferrum sp.]|nr:hypothetical protein [Candidatus Acidoferrum sp.]